MSKSTQILEYNPFLVCAHNPRILDRKVVFKYEPATQDLIIYPLPNSINFLRVFTHTDSVKETRRALRALVDANNISNAIDVSKANTWHSQQGCFSIFFRLGIIQPVECDDYDTRILYELTLEGRLALIALEQGHVWSSSKGINDRLTNQFYDLIVQADLDLPVIPCSYSQGEGTRICYKQFYYPIDIHFVEEIAQTDRCKKRPGYKRFARKLILRKLADT